MLKHLAGFCLRLFGWQPVGVRPPVSKLVLVGYPHTSSWDLLIYVLIAWSLGIDPAYEEMSASGRPFKLANRGEARKELFA